MIYIGDKKLKSCYLGDEKIQKVYRGDELLFAQKSSHNLPQGYTELEYVEATGAQYISWYAPSSIQVFAIDCELPASGSGYIYGFSAYTTATPRAYLYYSVSSKSVVITSCFGSNSTTGKTSVTLTDIPLGRTYIRQDKIAKTLTIKKDVYDIDVAAVGYTGKDTVVFARMYVGSTTSTVNGVVQNYFKGKIYSWQCSTSADGTIGYDCIPCIQDSTGIAGFYDLVRNVFVKSASTTNFTAGPAL